LTEWKDIWRRALEDWSVEESQFLNEWGAKERAKGRVEARRDLLLRLLRGKFPTQLPPEVSSAIQAQADADELSRWFDLALTASSVEEFRSALGSGAGRPNGAAAPNS
jgi:hypothetical protein